MYSHTISNSPEKESFDKFLYIYQHFEDNEKTYPLDQQVDTQDNDTTLYPYINNNIEYGIFEDVIGSYHLDSEIKDDFHCNQNCFSRDPTNNQSEYLTPCTHSYEHIAQHTYDLDTITQQQQLHDMEEDASLFTTDTGNSCSLNINKTTPDCTPDSNQPSKIQPQNNLYIDTKHKYRYIFW